jgi:hypothetical protein
MNFIDNKLLITGIIITGIIYKYKVLSKLFIKREKNISMDKVEVEKEIALKKTT